MPKPARFSLPLILAFIVACSADERPAGPVEADAPELRYSGRWNFDEPQAPWVGWQGSSVAFRFRGTSAGAEIEVGPGPEQLRIIVDGVPAEPALTAAPGRYPIALATDLDREAEHTVVLMKESNEGSRLTLHGVTVDGRLLAAPSRPAKRIAFFGDSNMEGYSLYSEKDNGTAGTYFAYPATVARMLGAEMHLQARGSATLDGNGLNDVVSFVRSAEFGNEDPAYSDGFEPDVIVVNAGANDIYKFEPPLRKEAVSKNYRSVIAALRDAYGDKPHIVLYNAYSWDVDEPVAYSQEVVDAVGGKLSALQFPWCWEQWHGDMVDHAGQARRLARYIESLDLGFELVQEPLVVDGYGIGVTPSNPGFEGAARDGYGGFGWRYFDDGVERVRDPEAAHEGEYFIRLDAGESVHDCVDASGDFEPGAVAPGTGYELTAAIRSVSGPATAILAADYEGQALYRRRDREAHAFEVDGQWRDYSAVLTAPADTWKVYVVLESGQGTVEFDSIRMRIRR